MRSRLKHALPRATVTPPQKLLDMVFDWVPAKLKKVQERNAWAERQPPQKLSVEQKEKTIDVAAEGFLQMLMHYRLVLLQDAACLQDKHPNLRIFSHKVFKQPEWEHFKQEVLTAHATTESLLSSEDGVPDHVILALLEFEKRQGAEMSIMTQKLQRMEKTLEHIGEKVGTVLPEQNSAHNDELARAAATAIHVLLEKAGITLTTLPVSGSNTTTGTLSRGGVTSDPSQAAPTQEQQPEPQSDQHVQQVQQQQNTRHCGIADARATKHAPPIVELETDLSNWTINDVWDEFIRGRGDNRPIAEYMNKWRTAWRPSTVKRNGAAWLLRSTTINTIIETAKFLGVSNERAASLWVQASGFESLTLHQFKSKITKWNTEVRKEKDMGDRTQKKGDAAFGEKYTRELKAMYESHGEVFPTLLQTRDTRSEISCFEECREWLASN